MLEKVAADYAAKGVRLVKIDVDQDKVLAAQFQIQSIPTVYAIYQGQPVADLTNYRTEGQLDPGARPVARAAARSKARAQDLGQAEIEPLIAMGEQVLAEGDAARAAVDLRARSATWRPTIRRRSAGWPGR